MAVGRALSWWEGSEDVLMGVFRWLCMEPEPTAFAAYIASPRGRRSEMLKDAFERYQARFTEQELKTIRAAMKGLDQLAATRNEIAHGHCSSHTSMVDGVQVMTGSYLLPSLNEGHWRERDFRYAHTAETIGKFEARVRELRGEIMDAHHAAVMRRQEARQGGAYKVDMARQISRAVDTGRLSPSQAEQSLTTFLAAEIRPPPSPPGDSADMDAGSPAQS